MTPKEKSIREPRLVWLNNEEFPRIRAGGRLQWLGNHGSGIDYHDPDCDFEVLVDEETDRTFDDRDPMHWCSPLPEGIWIKLMGQGLR